MIGKTISHFRITGELGGGGMGVVYRATDITLDRPVALKFLPPELTRDAQAKRRFIHEARAASALQHNNICTIHEIGESDDGHIFIAMDCYEGETLKERIARGPLPVAEAVDIATQVAAGLQKAHDAGMVHRDIKPANIMITSDGVVKLLDFGIAKLAGQTKVTKTGTTVGTVSYMSPEQVSGDDVDHRSDIWSLGIVLYEMLTGNVPFTGDHEAAVLYSIANTEPQTVTHYRNDLPEGLQKIVERALKKEPGKRFQSVDDFSAELRRVRSGISSGGVAILRAPSARRRYVPFLILFAVIAVVTAFVVLKRPWHTDKPQEISLAVVDFRSLDSAADKNVPAGLSYLLYTSLVQSNPCRVIHPQYLHEMHRRLFGVAGAPIGEDEALQVSREAGATLCLTGQVVHAGSVPLVMCQLVDPYSGNGLGSERVEGSDLLQLADRIVEWVLPLVAREAGTAETGHRSAVSDLTTDSQDAYHHFTDGLLARQEFRLPEAIGELKKAIEIDSTFSLAYFELGRAYFDSEVRGQVVQELADKAWSLRAHLSTKDRLRLEAWRQRMEWRPTEAIATYKELLTRYPDDRAILGDFASLYEYFWYGREAQELLETALQLYPDDQSFQTQYLQTACSSGRLSTSIKSVRAYVDRFPNVTASWDIMGLTYLEIGHPDSAETAFRKSLEIDSRNLMAQQCIALCAYSRGDLKKTIDISGNILRRSDLSASRRVAVLSNVRFSILQQICGLPFFEIEAGHYEKALRAYEDAKQYMNDIEKRARVQRERCYALKRMGRFEEILRTADTLAVHTESRYPPLIALEVRVMALTGESAITEARGLVEKFRSGEDRWGNYIRIIGYKLDADIALAEENPEAALTALNEMHENGFPPGGLIDIEYREGLARAHQMAGRFEKAVQIHKELLRIYGGHALSYYYLGTLYEKMGRAGDAAREYEIFLEMWSDADEGLPQVLDARNRLSAIKRGP